MNFNRLGRSSKSGLSWGPFTLRVPFIHTRFVLPEFLQGLLVTGATGLAMVPLLTSAFGLSFEEAVAMCMLHSTLICTSWLLFGEPYCSGWATPVLPFTILFVVSGDFVEHEERFRVMTALSLDLAAIMLILGVTGLGARLVRSVPDVLKGGVILGAALAAFLQIFDFSDPNNIIAAQPYATVSALVLALLLAFSMPLQRLKLQYPLLALIMAVGLLPGFVVGGIAGVLAGELHFQIEWGVLVPPLGDLWAKVSPFSIGWPDIGLYIQCLPLALVGYIILFGDLVTGNEMIREAQKKRADEVIDINPTRSHLAIGIRNVVMALVAPLFPTQGALWTGVHAVVVQRWSEGRKNMESLFDGIASYYLFGLPMMFIFLPVITALKPLLGIALIMTLALTGFACASIALGKAKTDIERGVMLLTAVSLAVFEPWQGLLIGVIATITLVGLSADAFVEKEVC